MPTKLKTLSPEAVAMLIFIACGAAIHFGGDWLKRYALALPQTQILQRDPPAPATQPKAGAIHIIRETQANPPVPPLTAAQEISANQIFEKSAHTSATSDKADSEVNIDYFEQLAAGKDKHLQLNALMHNGAIINGRFIALHGPIESVAYPGIGEDANNPSKLVAPLLVAVDQVKQTATVGDPIQKKRVITLNLN